MATVLIKNGYLLDPERPLEQGDIFIQDDKIARIAPHIESPADAIIDATNKVVMPGLISAHTHAFTLSFRGLTDNLPLEPWLLFHMYAGWGKLGSRDLYVSSAIGAIELLKTGTTSLVEQGPVIGDLNIFQDQVAAIISSFQNTGIRAVIAPNYADSTFSERNPLYLLGELSPESIDALNLYPALQIEDIFQAFRSLVEQYQGFDPRLDLCLGPGNPNSCSRELMERTVEFASEFGLGIHSHLMESKVTRVFQPSLVDYLSSIHCLGPHVSLAHGVWIDEKDISILAETNTNVIHNPISNLKLGSGIAPVQAMKAHGLNVALGADNPGNANDSQNMFEVMKFAALIHKLYGSPKQWLDAQDAFSMCLTNGAKVLRKKVGSLQPGYLADIAVLETDRLFIASKENLINQLVYSDLGSSVETVLVGGRIVVKDKKVQTVNEEELYTEAKESAKKLYADMPALSKQIGPALDLLAKMCQKVADTELPFTRLARM